MTIAAVQLKHLLSWWWTQRKSFRNCSNVQTWTTPRHRSVSRYFVATELGTPAEQRASNLGIVISCKLLLFQLKLILWPWV